MDETTTELNMRTKAVASPMANPLITAFVTASVGHMPRSCLKMGFSSHYPFVNSLLNVLVGILSPTADLAFFYKLPHPFKRAVGCFKDGLRRDCCACDGVDL